MQQKFTLASILLFLALSVSAQQYPFYTQWIFNPYTVNPAMVAAARRTEVNVSYRQQWTGITDGPRTMQFDIQHPLDPRMAIGLNVYNDRTVLLSATSAMLTFGYKVPLATNHSLGFGISAGIFSNRIRQEQISNVDATDPAILNSTSNNFSFDGQFGVNYAFKNFSMGFSMLKLVDHKTLSEDNFQKVSFSQLKNKVAFMMYRFNIVPDTWAFTPAVSYRFYENDLNLFEATGIISYKNVIDLGGGYRQSFGANALLRVHIKDIEIGYAYDFPAPNIQVSTGGSNEVQLKWRFGKFVDPVSRKGKKASPSIKNDIAAVTPPPATPKEEDTEDDTKDNKNTREPNNTRDTPVAANDTNKPAADVAAPDRPNANGTPKTVETASTPTEANPNTEARPERRASWQDHMEVDDKLPGNYYYLIVGTFKKQSNANKLVRNLAEDGTGAEVKKVDDYYYVHISKYKTKVITLDRVMEIRQETPYADAWYKRLE